MHDFWKIFEMFCTLYSSHQLNQTQYKYLKYQTPLGYCLVFGSDAESLFMYFKGWFVVVLICGNKKCFCLITIHKIVSPVLSIFSLVLMLGVKIFDDSVIR